MISREPLTIEGHLQLTFLDLIEVKLIDEFLRFGVGWMELRAAAQIGASMLDSAHPFAALRFRTDGRKIFAHVEPKTGERQLVEIRRRQQVFRQVIEPALVGVEFDATQAVRWWPLGEHRGIVIDPKRCFGKPIAARSGVPAEILASYARLHGAPAAAHWYEVDIADVRDALAFHKRIAA